MCLKSLKLVLVVNFNLILFKKEMSVNSPNPNTIASKISKDRITWKKRNDIRVAVAKIGKVRTTPSPQSYLPKYLPKARKWNSSRVRGIRRIRRKNLVEKEVVNDPNIRLIDTISIK